MFQDIYILSLVQFIFSLDNFKPITFSQSIPVNVQKRNESINSN